MFFVGCLLLGIGLGIVFGQAGAGTLIGLGAGFIAEGLAGSTKKRARHDHTL